RRILPAMQASPNAELLAIQKRSLVEAQAKAVQYKIPLAFDSAETLAQHSDIDAVYVASAVCNHAPDTIAAARAGKHVLVEKPMAMNAAEAQSMIDACNAHGVKLMVAHMLRFSPLLAYMKGLMKSGIIGAVTYARAEFMFDARTSQRSWMHDKKIAGGGCVFDIGVHCLDTLRFVLKDEVVSLKSQRMPEPTEKTTEETAVLALQFSRGTPASIYCSFHAPYYRSVLEIVGQDGVLTAESFSRSDITASLRIALGKNGIGSPAQIEKIDVPNLVEQEITFFSESILNNAPSPIPGEEGLKNQIVLDKAVMI
ncbi:MAG TPA: Gfo/Idh/MocA family oxidoreductase, partial [Bacteroidota bacterium]|nr:Gfo/Idh/MocA family oxidoreductase [Bacteroidota bacterium]